jgi:hypothetical protein
MMVTPSPPLLRMVQDLHRHHHLMEENQDGVPSERKRWRRAATKRNERIRNGDKRLQQVINSLYQPPPYEATATAT